MANNNSARQTHVSPGVYTKEIDLTYASKSLGITTLGVAGETVKGPAFQPILIENWREFQRYFGGTSTAKFRGSQYPKYELPYIAQSYLKQSNQLQVCRVLGLSGVNAGPAWVITATSTDESSPYYEKNIVISVLRSRGEHKKARLIHEADGDQYCNDVYEFDGIDYCAKAVWLFRSDALQFNDGCNANFDLGTLDFNIDATNYGRFNIIVCKTSDEEKMSALAEAIETANRASSDDPDLDEKVEAVRVLIKSNPEDYAMYSVSFNTGEQDYVLNVLGSNPENGDACLFVEELYDVSLKQLIEDGKIDKLNHELMFYPNYNIVPEHEAVRDIITSGESELKRKDVGDRYLFVGALSKDEDEKPIKVHYFDQGTKKYTEGDGKEGWIYEVMPDVKEDGTRVYYYVAYAKGDSFEPVDEVSGKYTKLTERLKYWKPQAEELTDAENIFGDAVRVLADNSVYMLDKDEEDKDECVTVTLDFNNYKEEYRYASTPWIVSEMKGSATNVELTKLFRFHTISDGNNSNTEVKVSIENIEPEYGTFDVLVRDFYDTDANPVIFEKFKGLNLVPGTENFIAKRIGSFDESYENVSSFITVEMNDADVVRNSIPAGFLGYPVRYYDGFGFKNADQFGTDAKPVIIEPYLRYNTNYDDEIRISKQYFGLSDIQGIDEDVLKYKGFEAYNDIPDGLTPGFHLDSRIFEGAPDPETKMVTYHYENVDISQKVSVDGVAGYEWVTVGKGNTTTFGVEPKFGTTETMANTIYEDKRFRKFTLAFYGGWDGWDYYRTSRSNGDDFKYIRYKGKINSQSGEGANFSVIKNPETYNFNSDDKVINSDYYAYLYGIRSFANPKDFDINVFATPGIDYVNQNLLVGEAIEMIEEERADSIYVLTTPDKPFGAGDSVSEMFTPSEAVDNLDYADIDSNYCCTYFPWVKYYDADNKKYIFLPPTRDVVKNMALTDNTRFPWFPAAGWNRGDLDSTAVKPRKSLKLGEQDELYANRINFINNFAQDGMKIWGDNNMQVAESQMNKISKRRLLLHVRKLCAIAAIGLIFDPNDNTTKQAFESAVTPILDNVLGNRGITDWRLEIDDSQEARDRLELPAKIYLKLQPNLEYIDISFVITPSGVNFDDV